MIMNKHFVAIRPLLPIRINLSHVFGNMFDFALTNAILCVAVILLVIWWWLQSERNKFNNNIPSPPAIPILGNVLDFRNTTESFNTFLRYVQDYGGIVRVHVGPFKHFTLISDYKLLDFLLSSTTILDKSNDYRFIHPWLGSALLTAEGPKWKQHRRILNQAFHFKILEGFIEIFNNCSDVLIEKLSLVVGENSVDVQPFISLCALDIICESAMDTKIDAQNDTNSYYVRSVKNMCRITMERAISPTEMYDFLYVFTRNYATQKEALRILHDKANSVILQRKEELQNETSESKKTSDEDLLFKKKKPFLDLLLKTEKDGRLLSQEEIRQEVDTFMFAGHDTTAAAISFSLYCLANHPDVQQKAYEEQMVITEDNTKTPNYADLQDMKYLELVIKETLRLYPSVPIFGRQSNQDFKFGKMLFRKGDSLLIFPPGIHRNPQYYPEPEKFLPSRFENVNNKQPYAYIAFSAGPRNCIGQKYAFLEMKFILSKILRKFKLLPAIPEHKVQLATETVLSSKNGIKIRFQLRT